MDNNPELFSIRNISKSFSNLRVLDNISAKIYRNRITCVIGPSGSGKSTLLRCLNLLEKTDSGEILYKGKNILQTDPSKHRQEIGMVFQQHNLWSNRKVIDNLTLALMIVKKIKKKEAIKRAEEISIKFNLHHLINRYPKELSGGEIQRVSICRSLLMENKVLLLDEITSNLDIELTNDILRVIIKLKDAGIDLIMVTHQLEFVRRIADRVIFIDKGKIIEEGSVEILKKPKSERLKRFLNSMEEIK